MGARSLAVSRNGCRRTTRNKLPYFCSVAGPVRGPARDPGADGLSGVEGPRRFKSLQTEIRLEGGSTHRAEHAR